jgi:hypothetical protein
LKLTAALVLRCADASVASKLGDVLAPDNVGIPRSQRFATSVSGREISFEVEASKVTSVSSVLNSLLKDAQLFQEVWLLSRGSRAAVGRDAVA